MSPRAAPRAPWHQKPRLGVPRLLVGGSGAGAAGETPLQPISLRCRNRKYLVNTREANCNKGLTSAVEKQIMIPSVVFAVLVQANAPMGLEQLC